MPLPGESPRLGEGETPLSREAIVGVVLVLAGVAGPCVGDFLTTGEGEGLRVTRRLALMLFRLAELKERSWLRGLLGEMSSSCTVMQPQAPHTSNILMFTNHMD